MTLLAAFAGLALALAVIGVYGVMSYTVAQRTREIAIRMAVGASAHATVGWVLRRAALLAGAGIVAGVSISFLLGRFVERLLYGVRPADPLTLTIAPAILLATALAAALVPAVRATRVDPMEVLRSE